METLTFGYGGWCRWVAPDVDAIVYLRYARRDDGRWTLRELYIDADERDRAITTETVVSLPLAQLAAEVNAEADLMAGLEQCISAANGLGVLASQFSTGHGKAARKYIGSDWTIMAWYAQYSSDALKERGLDHLKRPQRTKAPGKRPQQSDSEYRLTSGPGVDGLSDAFLGRVKQAYNAAVARGDHAPNKTISADCNHPYRTVTRWVYEARKRGVMPPAARGVVG